MTGGSACSRAQVLVPLHIDLPAATFIGTQKPEAPDPDPEPLSPTTNPAPLLVPPGLVMRPSTKKSPPAPPTRSPKTWPSDRRRKERLRKQHRPADQGAQWVQIDLEKPQEIFAVVVWHAHDVQKVYHGVIVQVADGPDFTTAQNVRTLFNNDVENKAGLGIRKQPRVFRDLLRQNS